MSARLSCHIQKLRKRYLRNPSEIRFLNLKLLKSGMNTETTFWNCPPLAVVTVVQKCFRTHWMFASKPPIHTLGIEQAGETDVEVTSTLRTNTIWKNKTSCEPEKDRMTWCEVLHHETGLSNCLIYVGCKGLGQTKHHVRLMQVTGSSLCESSGRHLCTIPASHVSVDGSFSKNSSNLSMGIRMSQKFGTLKIHQNTLGPLRFLRLHLEIWAEGVHPTSWACGPFAHVGAFEPNGSQ